MSSFLIYKHFFELVTCDLKEVFNVFWLVEHESGVRTGSSLIFIKIGENSKKVKINKNWLKFMLKEFMNIQEKSLGNKYL